MPRYILIDNASGYIWGDHTTSDQGDEGIIAAAQAVDAEAGGRPEPVTYEVLGYNPRDTSDGYHVYRSDVRGSDQIGNILDGQDQELIDAVARDCEYVGYVRVTAQVEA
jgi:hypothetical protein